MRRRFISVLFALVPLLVLAACGLLPHPDTFRLDETSSAPMQGYILSDLSLVEKTFDNEIKIHKDGVCSIKRPDLTTNYFAFTAKMYSGKGLRVMTRTDRKKYQEEPGLVLEWTPDGSVVYENGKEIARADSVRAPLKSPVKLAFINEGSYFLFIADCDTIIKGRTALPESEYYILESMGSEFILSGMMFEQLYGFEREQILEFDDEGNKKREEKIIIK
jgi:hypothetical protein